MEDIGQDARVEKVVRAVQARIREGRDADIVIRVRDGKIVELTNTDIVRFK